MGTNNRSARSESSATGEGNIPARNWLDGVYEANKEKIKYPTFKVQVIA